MVRLPLDRSRAVFILALAAIPLILILINYLLSVEFRQTSELRGEVERSQQVRAHLQSVLSVHQDIETGARGFALTDDPAFLAPYEAARGRVRGELDGLDRAIEETSELRPALPRLRALSRERIVLAEELVRQAAPEGGREEALRPILQRGKEAMDRLRAMLRRMSALEQERLDHATARFHDTRMDVRRMAFGLQALLIALLIGAVWQNGRSMEAKRRAIARLRDLSARQEAVFASATDGMVVLNPSGSIESLNPAAACMYGYSEEELIRRDAGLLFEAAPDRGRIESFLRRLQANRRGEVGRIQEFWGRRKDGSTFPTDVSVSPVALVDGVRYLAVIRDISERKQVEQMKSEFVSTVSHELRTPLTSIAGSLGLLSGGAAGALPDKAMRLIRIARSNSERLVRLINDILDMEKIESGRMVFDPKDIPLRAALEQAVEANRAFAAEYQVELCLDPVPETAQVVADEDRFTQVMTNLLSNAAKFSPAGEAVRIWVKPLDRRYRITVADKGPGIPDEFRDRIFGKFAQADSSDTRQKGGTGLGLSIVREIVTRLGGSVSFDSRPGGTEFHVDLPASRPAVDVPVERPASPPGARFDRPQILHLDDDPDTLRVVASAFEGEADVHSTPSVQEGRAALQRQRFDAVVLDIAMADGSGLDLLPLLRSEAGTRSVVFTAQDADPNDLAGADAVLVKSRASLDQLVETVMSLARRDKERT